MCSKQTDRLVKQVDHYKYLGIILDAHLNFKEHVANVFGKVSSRLGVLRRIRKNLTLDAANKVYKSTILPILDYCDVAWNSIGQNECKKLEQLQKRAANIVLLSSAADMEDLKWLSLIGRRRMHTNCLTFKCLKMYHYFF